MTNAVSSRKIQINILTRCKLAGHGKWQPDLPYELLLRGEVGPVKLILCKLGIIRVSGCGDVYISGRLAISREFKSENANSQIQARQTDVGVRDSCWHRCPPSSDIDTPYTPPGELQSFADVW